MSTPSDPEPSAAQPSVPQPSLPPPPAPAVVTRSQPSTQEIPVVAPAVTTQQLPPHPGATPPQPVPQVAEPIGAAQPTGPVDFVPGLPGAGTAPPPPPAPSPSGAAPEQGSGSTSVWPRSLDEDDEAPGTKADRAPRDRSALLSAGLVVLALALLQLGLGLRFDDEPFWSSLPLWSAFATVCTVLGLAASPAVPGISRLGDGTGWRVAAGGLVGLAVFWVLVVLPVVAGDRGFLLTAALGCLGGALWTATARRS